MSTTLRPRWVRLIGVPVTAIGLAGLVACGTGSTTGSTGSATGGSGGQAGTSSSAAVQAFASCMAENGVTLPERGADGGSPPTGTPPAGGAGGAAPSGAGSGSGGAASGGTAAGPGQSGGAMSAPLGVDATAWAAAQKACAQYAPTPPSGNASS